MPTERTQPLSVLGLPVDASAEQVQQARSRLLDFLAGSPPELAEWARQQRESIESAAGAHEVAVALGPDEEVAGPVAVTPARPRPGQRRALAGRTVPAWLVLVLLAPTLVWTVYAMGRPPEPAAGAGRGPAPTLDAGRPGGPGALDTAAVTALEAKVAADPADTASMRELGALYAAAGDFENAADWQQKIIANDPKDVDARLALGVALFNDGDLAGAQAQWTRASQLAPDEPEPYYNLGFLYLSQPNPDMEKVERAWGTVLELAPDSELAETVSAHLGRLDATAPGSGPTPTGR